MSDMNKMKHVDEDLQGKTKEEIGKATGNERMEGEGLMDQTRARTRKAADDKKDEIDE